MGLFDAFNNIQNQFNSGLGKIYDFFGNNELEKCVKNCKDDCKKKHSSNKKSMPLVSSKEDKPETNQRYKSIGPIVPVVSDENPVMESQPKELNQENNETRENEKVVSLSEGEAESVPVIGGKKRTRHKKRHNKTKRKYKSKHKKSHKNKHNKTKRKYKSNNKKRVRRNTKRKKRKSKK